MAFVASRFCGRFTSDVFWRSCETERLRFFAFSVSSSLSCIDMPDGSISVDDVDNKDVEAATVAVNVCVHSAIQVVTWTDAEVCGSDDVAGDDDCVVCGGNGGGTGGGGGGGGGAGGGINFTVSFSITFSSITISWLFFSRF